MSTEASASANSLDSQDTRLNGGMLSPIDVQFKLTLDATARQAAAQASRPLRLALDYASVTLPSIDDLESRFVVYITSRCVVDAQSRVTDCAAMTPLPTTTNPNQKRAIAELDSHALTVLDGAFVPSPAESVNTTQWTARIGRIVFFFPR